ncbi:MAG: hypothetical protein H6Q07_564 [Acidobacteria bacterium]|nr:hypothetical protein [Acidobacteriota bacterium]
MTNLIGFLPTTNIPRAHSALARMWRCNLNRRRLDAIFMSWPKLAYARALGWEEMGSLEEVPPGWTSVDTLAEYSRACDVSVLLAGDEAYYANCQRAAAQIGLPSWVTWQEKPYPCDPLAEEPLISEMTPGGPPDYAAHGTFDDFWTAVDSENRFTWIVRLDAVGDLLLTLSFLYPFKKRYPHRRIGLVVRDRYVPWLKEIDWLDAVCATDVFYRNRLIASAPGDDGRCAWMNLMPGMLRVAGNRLLAEKSGPRASAYPDADTPCEFSPGRHIVSQRELLASVFGEVAPELPVQPLMDGSARAIWFSPYPGSDERLWPPDSWAAALEPLAGYPLILQTTRNPLYQHWEAEFTARAVQRNLRIEMVGPTRTIFDLARDMSSVRGWIGVNSAPMHVAALLGLPSLALGMPWEINAMWSHPGLQIVAAESYAQSLLTAPSTRGLQAFAKDVHREDNWADGLYLRPETVADCLLSHPMRSAAFSRAAIRSPMRGDGEPECVSAIINPPASCYIN